MTNSKKLAHLHLEDYMGNKSTLLCFLKNGCIIYRLFGSWNSSGTPFALSNLQCTLPVYPEPKESEEQFVNRIIDVINNKSVEKVTKSVPTKIEF